MTTRRRVREMISVTGADVMFVPNVPHVVALITRRAHPYVPVKSTSIQPKIAAPAPAPTPAPVPALPKRIVAPRVSPVRVAPVAPSKPVIATGERSSTSKRFLWCCTTLAAVLVLARHQLTTPEVPETRVLVPALEKRQDLSPKVLPQPEQAAPRAVPPPRPTVAAVIEQAPPPTPADDPPAADPATFGSEAYEAIYPD
jgi:hypothetical protein